MLSLFFFPIVTLFQAGAKKNTTSYQWRIHLAEPTVLQNTIEWDPKKSQEVLGAASYILHAGAHSLKVFGQTVALNIHKNVTDMVIPFINQVKVIFIHVL